MFTFVMLVCSCRTAALKHLQKPGSGRRDKGSVGGGTAASRGAKSRATGASASTAGHKSGRGGKDAGWGRGAGVAGAGGVGGLAEGSRFRNKKVRCGSRCLLCRCCMGPEHTMHVSCFLLVL